MNKMLLNLFRSEIVVLVVKTSLIRSTEAMEIDNMSKIIINIAKRHENEIRKLS